MDLNETDKLILAKLTEGRCTPSYLSDELSKRQPYISQRLAGLREEGYIVRIHRGLYEHGSKRTKLDASKEVERRSAAELIDPSGMQEESQKTGSSTKAEVSDNTSEERADEGTDENEEINIDELTSEDTIKERSENRERTGEWDLDRF